MHFLIISTFHLPRQSSNKYDTDPFSTLIGKFVILWLRITSDIVSSSTSTSKSKPTPMMTTTSVSSSAGIATNIKSSPTMMPSTVTMMMMITTTSKGTAHHLTKRKTTKCGSPPPSKRSRSGTSNSRLRVLIGCTWCRGRGIAFGRNSDGDECIAFLI